MKFRTGATYTIPNSSINIVILGVIEQDDKRAKLLVGYISKQGTAMGMESIDVSKEQTKHWEETAHVPFQY